MESLERKRHWLDLCLQHAVSEDVARSCIRDATHDAQLIAKIKEAVPGEGAEKVVQVLSFPEKDKRPWLSVLLRHGVPAKHAKVFVGGIKEGLPQLEAKLRRLIPARERAEALIKEVCTSVWRELRVLVWCM